MSLNITIIPKMQGCAILGQWPSSWETSATGTYTAYADFSSAQLSGSYWDMCIGNGWIDDITPVFYDGVALIDYLTVTNTTASPTRAPTTLPTPKPTARQPTQNVIQQTAPTGYNAVVDWYLQLSGSQDSCVTFRADGQLKGLDVSLAFQNQGNEESWPRDMFIHMKLLNPETDLPEACYQWGGYDYSVI